MVRLVVLRFGVYPFPHAQAPPRPGLEQVHLVRLNLKRLWLHPQSHRPTREVKIENKQNGKAMNENGFRAWLISKYKGITPRVRNVMARARRINRDFGDLDAAYAADHLDGYIARLQYSTEDEHNGRPAPEELAFRIDPKDPLYFKRIHEGLNSLRNAVELYRDYRDEG